MKTTLNLLEIITPLDWIIFTTILFITFASIAYGEVLKEKGTSEKESFLDLLIMGRQLSLPLFIGTLVATWYGGIFGVTEIAFNNGIYNFITQGGFWYISYLLFAFLIIHRIEKFKAVTLPDLIERMFGPKSAKLSAIFNFFNVLPIAYTISLGLFGQMLFGGTLLFNMVCGVSLVILYSMWGGIRAVIFSDIIQFFVMCLSVFLVLAFSISNFGGLNFLTENLEASYFSPLGKNSLATTLVWGFIALSTLVDPNFYQRCFAAKSSKTAKKGIIISTVIWVLFDICTTFGAMYAKAVIPEASSSQAYLTYAVQILPSGLRGFFLAGILATILSTLDSYIFLAGTTLSFDLAPKKYRGRKSLHYTGTIVSGLLAVSLAMYFNGNIKTVWKTLGSYSASCLLLPVLIGHLFPGKIKDRQFVFSCILSVITTTIWRNTSLTGFAANIDELYIGILTSLLSLIAYRAIPRLRQN